MQTGGLLLLPAPACAVTTEGLRGAPEPTGVVSLRAVGVVPRDRPAGPSECPGSSEPPAGPATSSQAVRGDWELWFLCLHRAPQAQGRLPAAATALLPVYSHLLPWHPQPLPACPCPPLSSQPTS